MGDRKLVTGVFVILLSPGERVAEILRKDAERPMYGRRTPPSFLRLNLFPERRCPICKGRDWLEENSSSGGCFLRGLARRRGYVGY